MYRLFSTVAVCAGTSGTVVEVVLMDDDLGKDEFLGSINLDIRQDRQRFRRGFHWISGQYFCRITGYL